MFYENGLSINVAYAIDEPKRRAVGFKLSEGMEVPAELGSFKFAPQESKLAGTIRGSYFNIKGEYWVDRGSDSTTTTSDLRRAALRSAQLRRGTEVVRASSFDS